MDHVDSLPVPATAELVHAVKTSLRGRVQGSPTFHGADLKEFMKQEHRSMLAAADLASPETVTFAVDTEELNGTQPNVEVTYHFPDGRSGGFAYPRVRIQQLLSSQQSHG